MTLCDGRKGASPTPVTRCRSDQPVVSNREADDDGGKYTPEMHRTENFKDSAGHPSKSVNIYHCRMSPSNPPYSLLLGHSHILAGHCQIYVLLLSEPCQNV